MFNIAFVCHGNICRSPMAEYIFKEMIKVQELEDKVYVASSATSYEEIGNPVYPPAKRMLLQNGISCDDKRAVHFESSDYEKFDIIAVMDDNNIRNLLKIISDDKDHKVYKLMDFTNEKGDIEDPWYTGNFEKVYEQIKRGCEGLMQYLRRKGI